MKKIQGVITKKHGNDKTEIRTNSMEGEFIHLPEIGRSFEIVGESLSKEGNCRLISTSPVKTVAKTDDKVYTFSTLNSIYELRVTSDI